MTHDEAVRGVRRGSVSKDSNYTMRLGAEQRANWEAFTKEAGFTSLKDMIERAVACYMQHHGEISPAVAADIISNFIRENS